MTSTTLQRACDSQVSRRRSTISMVVLTAVSKPMEKSVEVMSLSIVPGRPTQGTPCSVISVAPRNVPSPPIVTMPSMPKRLQLAIASRMPASVLNSGQRSEYRIVPPWLMMLDTERMSSGWMSPSISPR